VGLVGEVGMCSEEELQFMAEYATALVAPIEVQIFSSKKDAEGFWLGKE